MNCLQSFDDMCRKIVCPTRHHLNEKDMIQRKFRTKNVRYQLHKIPSQNGYALSAVVFARDFENLPTVLYLHGNGGHKLECLQLIGRNINLISFDFSGCGKTQGQFLTYGQRQAEDISSIVSFIQINYKQPKLKVSLWGRSMGASLAIMYASSNPQNVSCMVLDSPFRKLSKVIENVAYNVQKSIPKFVINFAIYMIQKKILSITDINVFDNDYLQYLHKISDIPILFCYSRNDSMVTMSDVNQFYESYHGSKQGYQIDAQHHEDRPKKFIEQGMNFVFQQRQNSIQIQLLSISTISFKKGISLQTKRIMRKVNN